MRLSDLLTLPFASLRRQPLRTVLTTLGVVFGAFVLAASLSIGQGVQETIDRETRRNGVARRVDVSPAWKPAAPKPDEPVAGAMTDARRDRLRKAIADATPWYNRQDDRVKLTRERLNTLAAMPHVETMTPILNLGAFAVLGEKSQFTGLASARPTDEALRRRIIAGRLFNAPDERGLVVSELLAYRLGCVDEADVARLIGQTLRLEFRRQEFDGGIQVYLMKQQGTPTRDEADALQKIKQRLPDALDKLGLTPKEVEVLRSALVVKPVTAPAVQTEEFPVVGVIRQSTEEELKGPWNPLRVDADAVLPFQTAVDVHFRVTEPDEQGVDRAILIVDAEANVKDVVQKVQETGLDSRAAVEFIDRERLIYLLIFGGMTCVAAVALLVSALGIANTMLMSVLERTREIGVMKAVGADNRHLLVMFLIEGALIGFFGGVFGLLLAWAASYPGDAWIKEMVLRDMKIDLAHGIFVFPPWLVVAVLTLPVVVTTLAAVYPARHAARIDPVKALRHE
ncbi:ABC transporter permease [Paludisphaera borealis]|uniref:ABC transporter permease YtrF n=1 Tax=Paludisphaera borealis TaxID=1387353 RepID=A0A1U7CQG2_9BACT|nr:ABC transporter permease [Paludisphaera borealis]APW61172.1 ABC transporter permease YtrF [Paludisphaera borealis]